VDVIHSNQPVYVAVVLADKPLSKLEMLAKMRDMKRRRQSYRGKSTHTANKNYTEVLPPFVSQFVTCHTECGRVYCLVYFLLCPVTAISVTVALIGVKFCGMVHMCPECTYSPFWGSTPRGSPKSEILAI